MILAIVQRIVFLKRFLLLILTIQLREYEIPPPPRHKKYGLDWTDGLLELKYFIALYARHLCYMTPEQEHCHKAIHLQNSFCACKVGNYLDHLTITLLVEKANFFY